MRREIESRMCCVSVLTSREVESVLRERVDEPEVQSVLRERVDDPSVTGKRVMHKERGRDSNVNATWSERG